MGCVPLLLIKKKKKNLVIVVALLGAFASWRTPLPSLLMILLLIHSWMWNLVDYFGEMAKPNGTRQILLKELILAPISLWPCWNLIRFYACLNSKFSPATLSLAWFNWSGAKSTKTSSGEEWIIIIYVCPSPCDIAKCVEMKYHASVEISTWLLCS